MTNIISRPNKSFVTPKRGTGLVASAPGAQGPMGPPGPPGQDGSLTPEDLNNHVNDPEPHPEYDDGTSLLLLYENKKV